MQTPNSSFISGLDLCESFYHEAVEPIIRDRFAELPYAAALIGSGSEVLGFDTEISTDNHWGPAAILFVKPEDLPVVKEPLNELLSEKLPRRFRNYPTTYLASSADDDKEKGIQVLDYSEQGPINHRVSITTVPDFLKEFLGFDPGVEISSIDWLSFPEQKLLSIGSGRVFHDQVGLEDMRSKFAYYPDDVWLYLLAAGWSRIEQEEHLMGRAGDVGDEIGSAIIASRLVRDLMRLCFLMERRYAPYPKWFGSAFLKLEAADKLQAVFLQVLSAKNWKERQKHLVEAYEYIAERHNQLAITEAMPVRAVQFHSRPYRVISMGVFSKAISAKIADPLLKELIKRPLIGSIDQFSDSTELLANPTWRQALCALYVEK